MGCVFVENQVISEYFQFKAEKIKAKYLFNFWNVMDWTYLGLNIVLLVNDLADLIELPHLRRMAVVSVMCLFMKFFDWLRLFDETAFYVSLMFHTIYSIQWFMLIMVIWWMAFGTAFQIINKNRLDEDPESSVVPHSNGAWLFDALQNQYELGLSEF